MPLNLRPYIDGEIERPTPSVGLCRNDGVHLLYPGLEHAVIGEMEAGKSWFALASAAAELQRGNHVLYIHFEESDPSDTVERLLILGVPGYLIARLFLFVAPESMVSPDAWAYLLAPKPSLAILDGVNEGMSLHKWGIRDEDGAASFRRHLVKPCTRSGAAVLSCDHVVKDKEARGRNALGSIHKGNGLSGSLILLENAEPFGRGQRGRSHVYVTKDRPGFIRRNGNATKVPGKTFVGELIVDDEGITGFSLQFFAPKAETREDVDLAVGQENYDDQVYMAILELESQGHEANLRAVRAKCPLGKDRVEDALTRLTLSRRITEARGVRRARVFHCG